MYLSETQQLAAQTRAAVVKLQGMDAELLARLEKLERLAGNLAALESDVRAMAPLRDPDRVALSRVCKAQGVSVEILQRRVPSKERAAKVRGVFRELKLIGLSVDRIARVTGYSSRGVVANLSVED
jgi:hypothetical protein